MNIQQLMKQAQSMQSDMEKIERELNEKQTTVKNQGLAITMNGKHELVSVAIDPSLLTPENKEIIEDLMLLSINQATKAIQDERADKLGALTKGLNLPGFM
ncbi:MAG: nucleoid-associated protein, YbaB/EbfC family [Firmicutes bacterium GWF2_51_9]|nr:MAG: nucleoid-associated protein, YbaB/EbfC family [Firmicutes bacterium GWF2_51_9]OGS58145.1 MAG: nucleoid-associated protein, YbaB/EbfC family [Firmicutes bacterium GWE2_51_13]HAM63323.1 YbaB/EbfC family nucleoid-associated protein [Erysipelotrichaceae bacterium]HAO61190.1 YbaB/EbfC family nucleoid-associated protein [Erysipelotrichaceae bacterium]HBZ42120.1 YbaB/EbfC family nucleoid-associated protein [Erysipelotrichaceae bacterium]